MSEASSITQSRDLLFLASADAQIQWLPHLSRPLRKVGIPND
jgi:hypothetical protein